METKQSVINVVKKLELEKEIEDKILTVLNGRAVVANTLLKTCNNIDEFAQYATKILAIEPQFITELRVALQSEYVRQHNLASRRILPSTVVPSAPVKRKRSSSSSGYGQSLFLQDMAKSLSKRHCIAEEAPRAGSIPATAIKTRHFMSALSKKQVDTAFMTCQGHECVPIFPGSSVTIDKIVEFLDLKLEQNSFANFVKPKVKGERKLAPKFIEYLEQQLGLAKLGLKMVDADKASMVLEVPINKNVLSRGRPDAVIVPASVINQELVSKMLALVEFKCEREDVLKTNQPLLELLAATVERPYNRVLVITTDMTTYRLTAIIDGEVSQVITDNRALSVVKAFLAGERLFTDEERRNLVQLSINAKTISHEIQQKSHGQAYYFIDENPFEVTIDYGVYGPHNGLVQKIEKSFMAELDGNAARPDRGRSGQVYFIKISLKGRDDQNRQCILALKLHSCNLPDDILKEMENEASIYHKLGDNWSDESEVAQMIETNTISWRPRLVYAGYLFNNDYFAVCTTKIDGSTLGNGLLSDVKKKACMDALLNLHSHFIAHLDVRRPNFVFVKPDSASILDFGFSRSYSNENDDFARGVKKDLQDFKHNFD